MAFQSILLNVKLILILTIILLTAKFATNDTDNVLNDIRLIPVHYDIEIRFDVYRNIFFGKCNITIQVNHPTENVIIKNSGVFGILEVDLIDNDDNEITSRKHSIKINIQKSSLSNKTVIHFDFTQSPAGFLSPGTYILKMIYVCSTLNDDDPFQSYYRNREKVLNVESIQVLTIKDLFLWLDEPLLKSTFNISIYHHKNYKLLSNMPIRKKVKHMRNMLWTHFDKSSLMSARHLTILIINTVWSLTNTMSFTNNVNFWCQKKTSNQMLFAEMVAEKVVHFLKEKSAQEISKIQYIAVKGFQHINITIPGFILLREEDITYNEENITYKLDRINRKMEVANLIAYQTISYWFNDVHLWSKEGFIRFMTVYILNKFQLIYRMMDLYTVQTQQESLRLDTLFNTDSLLLFKKNINTVYLFRSFFFLYVKSSLAWRMLYHLVSEDVFWTSIYKYINLQYKLSSELQTDELWSIIQIMLNNSTGNPHNLHIENIMNTWTTEQQNPRKLFVERSSLYNITIFSYIISDSDRDEKFFTLVTYTTKSNKYNFFVFDQRVLHINDEFDQNDWIIVNLQQSGYYRINYNIENWENLAHYLYDINYTNINVLNRAQLIDDAFYFLIQKELNFITFWNITHFLFKDTDYVAWYPMIKTVEYMTCIWPVQNTAVIKNKIIEMFHRLLLNIGYQESNQEHDHIKYLREEAVKWTCVLGQPNCKKIATAELQKNLKSSISNENSTDKHLVWNEWIYCKGLMKTNYYIWFGVYKKWEKTRDNTLLEYLTCSTNTIFNRNYIRLIMESELSLEVPDKEKYKIILLILAKHAQKSRMLQFVLHQLKFNKFIFKKKVAMLIVIITHEHSTNHFKMISEFVKNNLSDQRLVDAVEQKLKRRNNEYNKKVMDFEYYSNL